MKRIEFICEFSKVNPIFVMSGLELEKISHHDTINDVFEKIEIK